MVLVRNIELYSMCEHHLLPFHGVAHIGYIPGVDGRITGLSKLARLVDVYSRRPQVQERLTSQIADLLAKELNARGVIRGSRPARATCAWRCGASRRPAPVRRRRPYAACSKRTPSRAPKLA